MSNPAFELSFELSLIDFSLFGVASGEDNGDVEIALGSEG